MSTKDYNRYAGYTVLALLLFAFWMVVSSSIDLQNIALGLASSFLVMLIARRILGKDFTEPLSLPALVRFPFFALRIVWEVTKANIDVALIVMNPRLPIDPRVFKYECRLRGNLEKTVFAYCINLTPGTVTVDIENGTYYVHGLARRHREGLISGRLEQMVAGLAGYRLEKREPLAERVP